MIWIPLTLFGLAVAATVAIAMWGRVLTWAYESLLPWVKKYLPGFEDLVKKAFTLLDKVAVKIRRAVKLAWQEIRNWLLKQVVEVHRSTDNYWIKRVTSWLIKNLDKKTEVVKHVTEEVVEWDDLPEDIRQQWIEKEKSLQKENVTEKRDQEIASLELETE